MSNKRLCPKCEAESLFEKQLLGVPVDECLRCGGLWFDCGELEKSKNTMHKQLSCFDMLDLEHVRGTTKLGEGRLSCPHCQQVKMFAVQFSEASLIIDWCKSCSGAWLDAGELEQLMDCLHGLSENQTISEWAAHVKEEFSELLSSTPKTSLDELRDLMIVMNFLQLRACIEYPQFIQAVHRLGGGILVHPGSISEEGLIVLDMLIDADN